MKKILIISMILFVSAVSVLSSEYAEIYKKAEKGDAKAQCTLGAMYESGNGVTQDYKKAAYWWEKAAKQGFAEAQYCIGIMYEKGEGVLQDHQKSYYWWEKAAEQNYTDAQYNLGVIYAKGIRIPQDFKQAVSWYTRAAKQNHINAQYNLGILYYQGKGIIQRYKLAAYWFKKAAEQGHAGAQYNLGIMYFNGIGIIQNYKLGYIWESLAAAQRDVSAIKNRDIYAKKLSPQQLVKAQELAAKIQYRIDHPTDHKEQQPSISKKERQIIGSGTSFIITKDGYILTCHHVIEGASEIRISVEGVVYKTKLVRDDPNNDLALLKINGSFSAIPFSPNRFAKMGQEVFTIGYPNPGMQGISAKYTEGTISSLTGIQDDLRLYQISIPVQPGNSGGALVDKNGNVLGVIVAMLNAKTTLQISGSLPQNVNYAVKSIYAQAMLGTLPEISNKLILPSKDKSNAIDRVKKSTVIVLSYK